MQWLSWEWYISIVVWKWPGHSYMWSLSKLVLSFFPWPSHGGGLLFERRFFWVTNVVLQSTFELGLTKLSDISVYIKGCMAQFTKAWDNRKQVQLKFVSKHACQCEWCERACDKTYNACCSEHHFGFTHAEMRLVRVCQGHCYRIQPTIRLYT